MTQILKIDYIEKLKYQLKEKNIEEISIFEIEDKPFEKKIYEKLSKNVKINYLVSPMFLNSREDF